MTEFSNFSAEMNSGCHGRCVGRPLSVLSYCVLIASDLPTSIPPLQVKLVRTKGEVWEVVSMQNADETFSVLTSLKQVDKCDDVFIYGHTCHSQS